MSVNYVQFHIGDFLGDTQDMSAAEIGAYMMLLMAHYKNGIKGIPNDPERLRRITHTDRKVWHRIQETVLAKFTIAGEWLVHKRVLEELKKVKKDTSTGDTSAPQSVTKSPDKPLEIKDSTPSLPITNNQYPKIEEKNTKKENSAGGEIPDPFDQFFKFYPNPTGIGAARQAWTNQIFLKGANAEQMVTAAKAYARKHSATEKKFIPAPAKWLESQTYLDPDLEAAAKAADISDMPEWVKHVANRIGLAPAKSWFKGAVMTKDEIVFPTKLQADWVGSHYQQTLRDILQGKKITVRELVN